MFEPTLNYRDRRVEWPMLLALAVLLAIGALFIYSATSANESGRELPLYKREFFKHVVYGLMGLAGGVAVCLFDYRRMARWSLVFYWACIILLAGVLVSPIGTTNGWGAMRWIDLGLFQFQPSELAKLGFILALANYLSRPLEELQVPGTFLRILGMAALPFLLILKEPDLGSALVILPVTVAMMFVAGVPVRYLGRLIGTASFVVASLIAYILFAPPHWEQPVEGYQRNRILVYFGRDFAPPNATPEERKRAREARRDQEVSMRQALISVGSGGLGGKGWCRGTQNALGYLPRAVAHNDFIFSVIAEEKGFFGSVTVLILYSVILFTGIRIASQARDRLGKLLAVGIVTLLFSHVFINIGMNIRLMPVTGLPLPLLSYGGTSVICSVVAIGILQNIHLYRRS